MRPTRVSFALSIIAVCAAISLFAGDQKKKTPPAEPAQPSYELPQPAQETLDYSMYVNIRDEATAHSHIMEYASALMDGIGPRLTGSPNLKRANEWTLNQFTAMGCSNAHLEDWGEFGMGWEQLNTWVRMTSPDKAVFIAQAAPWSPSTNGAVTGSAVWVDIQDEKDFEKYKGKLAGKIFFWARCATSNLSIRPFSRATTTRNSQSFRNTRFACPTARTIASRPLAAPEFREKLGHFLADRTRRSGDSAQPRRPEQRRLWRHNLRRQWLPFGRIVYQKEHANPFPLAVTAIENYGRVYRLLKANVPVTIELEHRNQILLAITSTASIPSPKFPAPIPSSKMKS